MERDRKQVMDTLQEIEQIAEDVLANKQHIVNLDRRRNQTREALRSINQDGKSWMCFGGMFIKVPNTKAKSLLQEDFNKLDGEIGDTRIKLKEKVNHLRDLESKEGLKGFGLSPLSADEVRSIKDII